MANYHVTKNPNKRWNVHREGAQRVSSSFKTQKDAEREAKRLSSNSGGGEVRIHGVDGKIRDSDTIKPAKDPNPPKDKVH